MSVAVAEDRVAAGEAVVALVHAASGPVSVALARVERGHGREAAFAVDRAALRDAAGVVELAVPAAAPPSLSGVACDLAYAVVGRAGGDAGLARAAVQVVPGAVGARPHVARGSRAGALLLADWDARHFHLELVDADLRGGGWITGRLHRHGCWPAPAVVVRARCDECWLTSRVGMGGVPLGGVPFWDGRPRWTAERTLAVDDDPAWVPFSFDLPPGLPPAVEGRTVAWRYELRARCRRRHRPDETAALTPLLYD